MSSKKTRLPRRIHSEEPPLVSLDDLKSLLQELPEPSCSIAALIVLTGLRIGEMLALRWCDVELTTGTLRVRQTVYEGQFDTPKTKRSRMVVPLSPIAIQILGFQKQGSGTASSSLPRREHRFVAATYSIGSSDRLP